MVYDYRILFTDILFLPTLNIVRYFWPLSESSHPYIMWLPHFVTLAYYHPHSSIRIFPSAFIIRILSSAFFHPPSSIHHHPVLSLPCGDVKSFSTSSLDFLYSLFGHLIHNSVSNLITQGQELTPFQCYLFKFLYNFPLIFSNYFSIQDF